MLRALLLLELLSLSLAPFVLLTLFRRFRGEPPRKPAVVGARVVMLRVTLFAATGLAVLVALTVALGTIAPWQHLASRFLSTHGTDRQSCLFFLQGPSLVVQGLIGLAFVASLSWLTLWQFRKEHTRREQLVGCLLVVCWIGLYSALPFHLSSMDFDDFFVLSRFRGVCPLQENDKPYFTLYDYVFRIPHLFHPDAHWSFGFATNGWMYVLVLLNLLTFWSRLLRARAEAALGTWGASIAALAGCGFMGFVLLSHSLYYQLTGTAVMLVWINLMEALRRDERLGRDRLSMVLFFSLTIGLLVQLFSYAQFSAMWMPMFFHALALGYQRRIGWLRLLLVSLFLLVGVRVFVWQELHSVLFTVLDGSRRGEMLAVVSCLAVSLLLFGWVLWRARRAGRLQGWSRRPDHAHVTWAVLFVYGVVTGLLYVLPNTIRIGIPVPLPPFHPWSPHWTSASNHARYSSLFYPFVGAAVMALVARLRAPSWVRVAVVVLVGVWYSFAYLPSFYQGEVRPHEEQQDTGPPFQRQLRTLSAMERRVAEHAGESYLYLPVPRDHGDHFLVYAACPTCPVESACALGAEELAGRVLLVSRHTFNIIRGESDLEDVVPVLVDYENLASWSWEVQFFPGELIDIEKLTRHCSWRDH